MTTANQTTPQAPSQLEQWPIDQLTPYAKNARTHSPDQIIKLQASLEEFGMVGAIVVRNGTMAKGHGTLMAIRRIYEAGRLLYPAPGPHANPQPEPFAQGHVPVLNVSGWTDEQFRAYVLADNRLALDAGWDEDLLAGELADLHDAGYDLALTGFSEDELADLLPELDEDRTPPQERTQEDDVPETPAIPTSREGDVWRLGRHRLRCGDSTSASDLADLLAGDRVNCLWTDPPYNVNYEGTAGKIMNDSMSADAFGQFLAAVYRCAFEVMLPGAPAYIAHADTEGLAFRREFEAAGFKLASCLIWRKNSFVLGRSDYHWMHEPILYGWKPGAAHAWYGERDKKTVQELEPQAVITQTGPDEFHVLMGETGMIIRGQGITVEKAWGSILLEEKPKRNAEHPTMKPVALIERMLENSTQGGDIVLDLFGGSGSTLIACEKMNRAARLMELDPKFVDVIVKRWQDFTGRKARLEGTDQTFSQVAAERAA